MQFKFTPLILIISLGMMSVFGLWFFGSMNHNDQHQGCPLFLLASDNCPALNNQIGMIIYHLSLLSASTKAFAGIELLMIILSLTIYLVIIRPEKQPLFFNNSFLILNRNTDGLIFDFHKRFLQWISFKNKRDPLFSFWAYETA